MTMLRAAMAIVCLLPALASARAEDRSASDAVALAEFAIGASLGADDRARVTELAAAKPEQDGAARDALRRALAQVRALRDDAARAEARSAIVTRLYWDRSDPLTELIVERAGVVAADDKTKLVVRRADLVGLCASAAIAAGASFDREACISRLVADVRDLSRFEKPQQQIIAAGERRAALLARYWTEVPADRRPHMIDLARRNAGSDDPLRVARALESAAVTANLSDRLNRFGDAAARGLESGAASDAIGRAGRGF